MKSLQNILKWVKISIIIFLGFKILQKSYDW